MRSTLVWSTTLFATTLFASYILLAHSHFPSSVFFDRDKMKSHVLRYSLPFFALISSVHAFSFTASTASQCDSLEIKWTGVSCILSSWILSLKPFLGGQAPFTLDLIPVCWHSLRSCTDSNTTVAFWYPTRSANTKQCARDVHCATTSLPAGAEASSDYVRSHRIRNWWYHQCHHGGALREWTWLQY